MGTAALDIGGTAIKSGIWTGIKDEIKEVRETPTNARLGGAHVVEQAVKERYESITMNTRIRENIALAESAGSGKSIFEYDLNSNGAKDYLALTEEILSRNQ